MHIALFKALKSVNIPDDKATEVVEAFEEYMAMKMKEATAGLEAQMRAQTWLIGTLGSVIAIGALLSGLSAIIVKIIN